MVSPKNRDRLLLITFDLPNPVPGDPRYRDVDRYLRLVGTVMRPLKQTRLVITSVSESMIVGSISVRIGMGGGVAAVRVSRRSRIHVNDPGIRAAVRQAIRRYGSP
jgi:hypothetical protein